MKCEDLLRLLNDYVDGDIAPSICEDFAEHLTSCNPCNVFVDTIRKTVRLYREGGEEVELPIRFRQKLHQSLRERWRQTHGGGNEEG